MNLPRSPLFLHPLQNSYTLCLKKHIELQNKGQQKQKFNSLAIFRQIAKPIMLHMCSQDNVTSIKLLSLV